MINMPFNPPSLEEKTNQGGKQSTTKPVRWNLIDSESMIIWRVWVKLKYLKFPCWVHSCCPWEIHLSHITPLNFYSSTTYTFSNTEISAWPGSCPHQTTEVPSYINTIIPEFFILRTALKGYEKLTRALPDPQQNSSVRI